MTLMCSPPVIPPARAFQFLPATRDVAARAVDVESSLFKPVDGHGGLAGPIWAPVSKPHLARCGSGLRIVGCVPI